MWFRLAALFGMTVRELQARMDMVEFAEWLAYWTIEPWGASREDYRAGVLASAILAPWTKKGRKPPGPADFFPDTLGTGTEEKQRTPHEAMGETLERFAERFPEKPEKPEKKD